MRFSSPLTAHRSPLRVDCAEAPAGDAENAELWIEPLHRIEKGDGTAYESAVERATQLCARTGAHFVDGGRSSDGGKMLDGPHHHTAIFELSDIEHQLARGSRDSESRL